MLPLRGRDGSAVSIPFEGRLWVDHGLAAREARAQDRGIAAAHLWLIDDLQAAGTVERILPDVTPEPQWAGMNRVSAIGPDIAPGRLGRVDSGRCQADGEVG